MACSEAGWSRGVWKLREMTHEHHTDPTERGHLLGGWRGKVSAPQHTCHLLHATADNLEGC